MCVYLFYIFSVIFVNLLSPDYKRKIRNTNFRLKYKKLQQFFFDINLNTIKTDSKIYIKFYIL